MVLCGPLAGAIFSYQLVTRFQRKAYALKLHEQWWNDEFQGIRNHVWELAKDLPPAGEGTNSHDFLKALRDGMLTDQIHGAKPFYRLAIFFAAQNAAYE